MSTVPGVVFAACMADIKAFIEQGIVTMGVHVGEGVHVGQGVIVDGIDVGETGVGGIGVGVSVSPPQADNKKPSIARGIINR